MAPNARKGKRLRWGRSRQKPTRGNLLREQKTSSVRVMKLMGDREGRISIEGEGEGKEGREG